MCGITKTTFILCDAVTYTVKELEHCGKPDCAVEVEEVYVESYCQQTYCEGVIKSYNRRMQKNEVHADRLDEDSPEVGRLWEEWDQYAVSKYSKAKQKHMPLLYRNWQLVETLKQRDIEFAKRGHTINPERWERKDLQDTREPREESDHEEYYGGDEKRISKQTSCKKRNIKKDDEL